MNKVLCTIFLEFAVVAMSLLSLCAYLMHAQAQNVTFIQNPNNTMTILNIKEGLIFLVNTTSNQTISVTNFTGNDRNRF